MTNYKFQKPDSNAKEFDEMLIAVKAYPQPMRREDGFDRLVHGLLPFPIVMEYKQPHGTLTANEKRVKAAVEAAGGLYLVIRLDVQIAIVIKRTAQAGLYNWNIDKIKEEIEALDLV